MSPGEKIFRRRQTRWQFVVDNFNTWPNIDEFLVNILYSNSVSSRLLYYNVHRLWSERSVQSRNCLAFRFALFKLLITTKPHVNRNVCETAGYPRPNSVETRCTRAALMMALDTTNVFRAIQRRI